MAAVRAKAVVLSLLFHCLLLFPLFVCFCVCFLVLQSSRWESESKLFYLNYVFANMWLLRFCVSSSRYRWYVVFESGISWSHSLWNNIRVELQKLVNKTFKNQLTKMHLVVLLGYYIIVSS